MTLILGICWKKQESNNKNVRENGDISSSLESANLKQKKDEKTKFV